MFADWHRDVQIEPQQIDLESRWLAVEESVAKADSGRLLTLLGLAHERAVDAESSTEIALIYKAHEDSFPMRDNGRLLAMLAGAALVYALSKDDRAATFVAYAVQAAADVGWVPLVRDVQTESASFLTREGDRIRTVPPALPSAKAPVIWTQAVKDGLEAATTLPEVIAGVSSLGLAAQTALTGLSNQAAQVAQWSAKSQRLLSEENQILWWLVSGRSQSMGRPWAELAPEEVAVAGARELAGLIQTLPGPPGAAGLLAQLLAFNTGAEAPPVTQAATRAKTVGEPPASVQLVEGMAELTPIFAGLRSRDARSLLTDGIVPDELARRAFTELMLLRAHAEMK
jgi:hypothetical protein